MKALNLIFILFLLPNALISQEVFFYPHIAPIIHSKCATCHQPDNVGPMNLRTYEEVSSYGTMIRYVTGIRYMPPMKISDSDFKIHGDHKLSDHEIELIRTWIDSGMPKGDAVEYQFNPGSKNPQMINPDVTFNMATSFEQYGVYYDQYKVFVIPTKLKENKEIAAIEFVPGNKEIVRGCFISVDTTSKSDVLDHWDPQYGYFSFGEIGFVPMESRWYNWQPNKKMTVYPKGYGKQLPKNAKLLFHIHYGPTGIPVKDSSRLNIKFASQSIEHSIYTAPLINPTNITNAEFKIEANDSVRYHAKFIVPFDMELQGVFPQSHFLGRRWEIFAVDPNRKTSKLLKINDWDYHWKQMYHFENKVLLKKGTVVHAMVFYDNTKKNPLNPSDPPKTMSWGKRMFEELFMVYFSFNEISNNKDFSVRFNFTNTSLNENFFELKVDKPQEFNASLNSFDKVIRKPLLENKHLLNGKYQLAIDFTGLPFGNYYIEVSNKDGSQFFRKVLLYLKDEMFE